jgi:hypothetical protein
MAGNSKMGGIKKLTDHDQKWQYQQLCLRNEANLAHDNLLHPILQSLSV